MIILGVDPGLALTGWGLISLSGRSDITLIDYGCIRTKPTQTLDCRLRSIHQDLANIIRSHKPSLLALEELYFSKEARAVASIAQARGVILLSAALEGLKVCEYNPRHVKIALTGYGSADKNQMQRMVQLVLRMKELPRPDDAADALAIAICHVNTMRP